MKWHAFIIRKWLSVSRNMPIVRHIPFIGKKPQPKTENNNEKNINTAGNA